MITIDLGSLIYISGAIVAIFILIYEFARMDEEDQNNADFSVVCAPLLSWLFVVVYFASLVYHHWKR